jgi:hypothetical protein
MVVEKNASEVGSLENGEKMGHYQFYQFSDSRLKRALSDNILHLNLQLPLNAVFLRAGILNKTTLNTDRH